MRITVGAENLTKLFSGEKRLEVPSFQRNYSWRSQEIDQFIDDLKAAAKTRSPHFFGPVVLLEDGQESDVSQIIDGQQRLTSATMLIAVLRDKAFALEDKKIGKQSPVDQLFRNLLFLPPMMDEPRFRASYLFDKVFRDFILEDPTSEYAGEEVRRKELSPNGKGLSIEDRNNTKQLRSGYTKMRKRIDQEFQNLSEESAKNLLLDLFWALSEGFQIHTMVLDNEDDAYLLFETLNDRGLKLSPSDLLKTITLREIRKNRPDEFEDALKRWDLTVQNLGEYDFSKFLRHFLLTINDKPVQKPKVLTIFKRVIEEGGKQGASKNLDRLFEASELYAQLLDEDRSHPNPKVSEASRRMNFYSETHRVLLLTVLDKQNSLSKQDVELLFRAAEYLSFRWIAAKGNAQELEGLYQKLSQDLRGEPTAETVQRIVEKIEKAAPNDQVISELSDLDNSNLQRYILRRIEERFSSNTTNWGEHLSLEHLCPQNPSGDSAAFWEERIPLDDDESYAEIVSMIGNLTLLEKSLNSSIQDSDWKTKLRGNKELQYEGISGSTFNLNKPLLEVSDWNKELILDRTSWIHACTLALVGKEWMRSGKSKVSQWKPPKSQT